MPSVTIVGKEETFREFGLQGIREIDLESFINRLKTKFEQEYYDCEDVGQAILEGLRDVRNGRVDDRPWRQVLDEI